MAKQFAVARELRSTTRAALESGSPSRPDWWQEVAGLGWLSLHLPGAVDGSDAGLAELAVVLEELGAELGTGALLPTMTASAVLSDAAPSSSWIAGLGDGSSLGAVGLGRGLFEAGGVVEGQIEAVLGARWADVLVLRLDGDLLVLPAEREGVEVRPVAGLDPSLGLGQVVLTGLRLTRDERLLGRAGAAVRILRTLIAAEAAGGIRTCLQIALEYAKVREQFGRTIGSFQAVKHHLADLLVTSEIAAALAWDAARGSRDDAEADLAAAAAATVVESYRRAAQMTIQILGGIGFTWEHDAHLYLRRAVTLCAVLASAGGALEDVFRAGLAGVERSLAPDLPEDEAAAYRERAREFLAEYRATPEARRSRVLAESGYLQPSWPPPFGRNAGAVEQLVLAEELTELERPPLGIGEWVLLTLVQTANAEQIARWVPAGLAGEQRWCQLFSEPEAGSDAAAVRTRATRVDGGWRIDGQKIWTSNAQHCQRGIATVRTNPTAPKHQGITAMVIDLKAPGVTVKPLREITGEAFFNEVFFDGVFVPDADVVGAVDDGWRVARATLGNERVAIGAATDGMRAAELVGLAGPDADAGVRAEVAHLLIEDHALKIMNLRQAVRAVHGAGPGPEGSVTRLLSGEHSQRVSELALRLAGVRAVADDADPVAFAYLLDRCRTIAGGTSEIARNVIAERILGLPRELIPAV